MRTIVAALVLGIAATDAGAAVLYKLVDPVGRVTFSDTVPRAFEGTITRIEVDTGTNVIVPVRPEETRGLADYASVIRRRPDTSGEERLRLARERVEAARAALEDARDNSLAQDWIYLGPNNPLGMRRMPRPEYQARLQRLESDVEAAESSYDALRRELR